MAFADRADAVLARIRAELALPTSNRESGATDTGLKFALRTVERMKTEALAELPPRNLRYGPELGRMIAESWKLGSSLGTAIADLEHEYLNL